MIAQAGDGARQPPLSWLGIVRLGLVQTALGAIFVLSTSTLNRVMKIELALPAVVPGALIAIQYAVQVLRPRLGHGSDVGGRRTPLVIGGMAVLAVGGVLAAVATGLMTHHLWLGIALAAAAFFVIGVGVSAAGTALLVLLATRTAPGRRAAAATIAWVMMIVGFILTAAVAGTLLDPFLPARLVAVAAGTSALGFVVACCAVLGVEGRAPLALPTRPTEPSAFGRAIREIWAEPQSRQFAVFVFVSMLAYGGEEVMIEPFAGSIFGMTIGETARLNGTLHQGSLLGMILVAVVCTAWRRGRLGGLGGWMVGGCVASAAALVVLALLGLTHVGAPLRAAVFGLGCANGAYAVAAIGSMMQRVGAGGPSREGARMGLWGAAQAVAFGAGTLAATALADLARLFMSHGHAWQGGAYAAVFGTQAAAFLVASGLALRLRSPALDQPPRAPAYPAARAPGRA